MENTIKAIQGIDFEMLKQQKMALIDVLDLDDTVSDEQRTALNGILNMIDTIQDAVVKDGFRTEEEVFNLTDDGEEVWYVNYYQCPNCGVRWDDRWTSMSDDTCPNCDCGNISPYKSERA